ncbi:rCG47571 [Rattus norvegicus]|uniref:RCG47571 n=1 Tax=Rattus norvegicus TaxID=10116 RepID=A6HX60_RAT|nr:rCG47571 [Rattus norvegicus]
MAAVVRGRKPGRSENWTCAFPSISLMWIMLEEGWGWGMWLKSCSLCVPGHGFKPQPRKQTK